MGKPPTFIEPVEPSQVDHEQEAEKQAAPRRATTAVYILVVIGVIALGLLVGIALHVPRGE